MTLENLDQIRAAHAVAIAGSIDRQSVTRLPSMIVNNGLLAAAAFADQRSSNDESQKPGLKKAMDAVASYLRERKLTSGNDTGSLIRDLCSKGKTPQELQLATDEALAYLSFLKRFATKGE